MAKVNCEVRYPSHQDDAKHYDTATLRKHYLVENLMVEGEINMVYSMFDRIIAGGAVPVAEELTLTPPEILRSEYFTSRREIGIINVGGTGVVKVGDEEYTIPYKEAIYIGRGDRHVSFRSVDPSKPAHFYFNSCPAHKEYPTVLIHPEDVFTRELGSAEGCNHRFLRRYILPGQVESCQLVMGMTTLCEGSVWNTMPCHTHDRRMEVYLYFELGKDDVVFHVMGEPTETRHIVMRNEEAVISPSWSVHCASATKNYTFIWGMCGENQDFDDMDNVAMTDIR